MRDELGSVDVISDSDTSDGIYSSVEESMNFHAYGTRRNSDMVTEVPERLVDNKGFTGHEHIEEFGLIHMNGRVYDPQIGRFLSADPFVQAPENSQSFNRYSYVWNNPLSATDPSGYAMVGLDDLNMQSINIENGFSLDQIDIFYVYENYREPVLSQDSLDQLYSEFGSLRTSDSTYEISNVKFTSGPESYENPQEITLMTMSSKSQEFENSWSQFLVGQALGSNVSKPVKNNSDTLGIKVLKNVAWQQIEDLITRVGSDALEGQYRITERGYLKRQVFKPATYSLQLQYKNDNYKTPLMNDRFGHVSDSLWKFTAISKSRSWDLDNKNGVLESMLYFDNRNVHIIGGMH